MDYTFTAKILDPYSGQSYCENGLPDTTVRIYINPKPEIAVIVEDTLCFDEGTSFNISSPTLSGNPTGEWAYGLVTTPSGPLVSNFRTTGQYTDLNFTDNLLNSSDTLQWVDYTFTARLLNPRGGQPACPDGIADTTIRVYINPKPVLQVSARDTLCFEEGTMFTLSTMTPSENTTGIWSYDLQAFPKDGSVSGYRVNGEYSDMSFTDNLINNSATLQWVDYIFVPKIVNPGGGKVYCDSGGDTVRIRIWVNPEPDILVAVKDTLCFDEDASFTIQTLTPSGNTTGSWVYTLSTTRSDASVSGFRPDGEYSDLSFTESLNNSSDTLQWIKYAFTAKILDPGNGLAYCSDNIIDTIVTLYIDPEPDISVVSEDTLCSGDVVSFAVSTLTPSPSTTGAWLYDVNAVARDELLVSGYTSLSNLTLPGFSQTLVNTSKTLQWVDYNFTAKILRPGAGGSYCSDGTIDTTIRVYLNPVPDLQVSVKDTLCFEEGTTFTLETNTPSANTSGEWVYDLIATASDSSVSGYRASGEYDLVNFTENLLNTSDTLQWVDYNFSPKIANPGENKLYCSNGTRDTTIRIYINPEPQILVTVQDTLCFEEGATFHIGTFTPTGNTTGQWVYDLTTLPE